MKFRKVWLLAVGLSCASPLFGWGREGHQIVARIAEARLQQMNPAALERIRQILHGHSMADVASWPDEIRSRNPATSNWHYVNMPPRADNYVPDRDCPPTDTGDCVLEAIRRSVQTLEDPAHPLMSQEDALRFLIHFVGDLHEPLHGGYAYDKGGNDVKVTFFGQKLEPPFTPGGRQYEWNLHSVWDDGLISHTGMKTDAYVQKLTQNLPPTPKSFDMRDDPARWALESHRITRKAYHIPADHQIGDAYFQKNIGTVDRRLQLAGVRLAEILNEIFSKDRGTGPQTSELAPIRAQ